MITIILPSGNRVIMFNGTVYVNPSGAATTVVFSFAAGSGISPVTETLLTLETAAYLVSQIDAVMESGKDGVFSLAGSPAHLDAIAPNPFAVHADTININGAGFDPATLGFLYLNDVGTAPDFNSYKMSVAYVSPNQLTAKWVSDGGGAGVLNEQIAYFKDSLGHVSNVIGGVFLSGVIALTFSTITPNTASVAGPTYSGVIAGTGFLGSGINAMNLDDGVGHSISCSFSIDSDIQITLTALLGGGSWSATGTYIAYYSTDFGVTWTTTALTVAVS